MALSWLGVNRERNHGLLAVGMESGLLELWSLEQTKDERDVVISAVSIVRFDPHLCHASAVNRLRWKVSEKNGEGPVQLASCGADHCVRIFQVSI